MYWFEHLYKYLSHRNKCNSLLPCTIWGKKATHHWKKQPRHRA